MFQRVKAELQNINNNEKLRKRLGELNMDLSVLKLDETIRCPHGSVAKKLTCGKNKLSSSNFLSIKS